MSESIGKFYPTENVILDLRTSCTKDEAAAKLIGWMKGHVRHEYPSHLDDDEITVDNFVYTHSLVYGLQEQLTILLNAEWNRYYDAIACVDETKEMCDDNFAAIAECDDLVRRVATYLCDIDEELDKEFEQSGSSALKIDRRTTESSGEIHITLRSLDQWAQKKYGISILDSVTSVTAASVMEIANAAVVGRKSLDDEADSKGRLSRAVADRIYTTFAITLEAYVATLSEEYLKSDGSMHQSFIAEHLQKLAGEANKKSNLTEKQ